MTSSTVAWPGATPGAAGAASAVVPRAPVSVTASQDRRPSASSTSGCSRTTPRRASAADGATRTTRETLGSCTRPRYPAGPSQACSAPPQPQAPPPAGGAARGGAVRRGPGRGGARRLVRSEDRARHVPRTPRDPAPQRRPQAQPPRRPRRPRHGPPLPGRHVPRLGVPLEPLEAVDRERQEQQVADGDRASSRGRARRRAARTPARPAPARAGRGASGPAPSSARCVGSRLTISSAANSAHNPTVSGADHQPSPNCSHSSSGRPPTARRPGRARRRRTPWRTASAARRRSAC